MTGVGPRRRPCVCACVRARVCARVRVRPASRFTPACGPCSNRANPSRSLFRFCGDSRSTDNRWSPGRWSSCPSCSCEQLGPDRACQASCTGWSPRVLLRPPPPRAPPCHAPCVQGRGGLQDFWQGTLGRRKEAPTWTDRLGARRQPVTGLHRAAPRLHVSSRGAPAIPCSSGHAAARRVGPVATRSVPGVACTIRHLATQPLR